MITVPIMEGLYSIKAQPKNKEYPNFDANLPFCGEPSQEDVLDVLKLLRPGTEYFLGSVRITYLKDIVIN